MGLSVHGTGDLLANADHAFDHRHPGDKQFLRRVTSVPPAPLFGYCPHVDLTTSYERVLNPAMRGRYSWLETRNAAAVLLASNPDLFSELSDVLEEFSV